MVSPNVCRIFDLIEINGRELVSMEYVDGATLLGVLQERGPLELKEAQDIASQFLAGLEAIHKAGLVHRDVKPENIMLTRAGRVVVMDFGLARGPESGAGSVSGTPAYMAPEHAAGQDVDARADVYSAGVVLAEMVSPEGVKSYESRQSVWEGVRSEPAQVPDSPWAPVIQRAVARDRDRRPNSAHTLIRELEDVTLRVEGAEDLHPYPGLASFTENDAEYFFGREAEVEQMWHRIEGPPRMLVLVGPSGAGKTSFLQAGLLANAGADWSCVVCKPGNNPRLALGRALAHEVTGDAEAMELMLRFDDADVATEVVSRWRHRATNALLVVDQFEELFTQSGAEEQRRFSDLLAQIVLTANVHVLLSLRDDFLMRCHDHEAFAPIFSDLTPLRAPTGAALRRALVQPATKCGYRFEDDELVEEVLAEVEGERGALPLLAFALARLWEKRDRDSGLLTRQAYHDIGGVGGALARHAEATVDRIGVERIPVVRELFRNLVTAEGTRAVREWDELLSVFEGEKVRRSALPSVASEELGVRSVTSHSEQSERSLSYSSPARDAASEVLAELIDARLLTSYEVREDEHDPIRRVEIIHESLLANWPRLVRWQTQDQEGAQLRDELRQSARAWDDHGRHNDRLWTGTAYREFRLWSERYPGGLTEIEEGFAAAMTSFANRRKQRRRLAGVAAVVVATIVALVFAGLWRRSVQETKRAEAAKLLALGELELSEYPTASLAWATSSLELADTREGRLMALRALAKGPPVTVCRVRSEEGYGIYRWIDISPNGEWLVNGDSKIEIHNRDGSAPISLWEEAQGRGTIWKHFASDEILFTCTPEECLRWSLRDLDEQPHVEETAGFYMTSRRDVLFSFSEGEERETIHRRPLNGGQWREVGAMDPWLWSRHSISRDGSLLAYLSHPENSTVFVRSLDDWTEPPKVIGTHTVKILNLEFLPDAKNIAAVDAEGEIRLWSMEDGTAQLLRSPKLNGPVFALEPTGRRLAASTSGRLGPGASIWDLTAPVDTLPVTVMRSDEDNQNTMIFHPKGDWLITGDWGSLGFWPLRHDYPWALAHSGRVMNVAFTPDGRWLLTITTDGDDLKSRLKAWPLAGQNNGESQVLAEAPMLGFFGADLVIDPSGKLVATGTRSGSVLLVPTAGGPVRELSDYSESAADEFRLAFSPSGRLLAGAPGFGAVEEMGMRVWDLATGESRVIGDIRGVTSHLEFLDEEHILWIGLGVNPSEPGGGERVFNLVDGSVEVIKETGDEYFRSVSPTKSFMLTTKLVGDVFKTETELWLTDFESGARRWLRNYGGNTSAMDVHPTGQWIAAGDYRDGTVRVGPVSGKEPHLLLGHDNGVIRIVFSPDGALIASASLDGTVRLWPMPDMSKPPLHTLPRKELIAKLKTLTNLRAVRDTESSTGWKVEIGPFPGWETVPTW